MGIIKDDVIIDISAFIRTLKTHKVITPCYSFKMIPKISKHFAYVSCRLSCFHCTLQANLIKPSPLNHKLACSCDKLAITSAFCLYTCLPACLWITKQVPRCLLKVRQLRGRLMVPMLCFSRGWGLPWLSRGTSLCWDELTCSPGASVEGRERESQGFYCWQGQSKTSGCAVPGCYL